MTGNNTAGIWKWSVLLLVLCNIGLMVTIWLKPFNGGHQRPGGPRDYVIRELKFNDDQVKKYDELIKAHKQAMTPLRKESQEYRTLLFNNFKNEPNGLNVDSLTQLIANNQKQTELVTYHHFLQVRGICNDTQKADFDRIINDVMKQMGGGMHPGPHGEDGPPPPGDRENHPDGPPPPPPGENH